MATGVLQADGTRCYSGPNCQKHGKRSLVQQIADMKRKVTRASSVAPAPQVSSNEKDLIALLPKGNTIRRGINGGDNTALEKLDAESEQLQNSLAKYERQAINQYTMGFYDPINRYLRKGIQGIDDYWRHEFKHQISDERREEYKNMAENYIDSIDGLFARHDATHKEPRLLHKAFRVRNKDGRKTTPEDIQKYVKEHYQVGKVLSNKAYTSTSIDSDYMLAFSNHDPEQIIVQEIVSRKGIPLHEPGEEGSVQASEREVLLPRNSKFKIVGIKEASYESTYPTGRPTASSFFKNAPKKKKFTIIQMIEID
jgi:hypothetical protein